MPVVHALFHPCAVNASGATICCALDASGYAQVEYADNPSLSGKATTASVIGSTGAGFAARIPLTGLTPNTTYYYQVAANGVVWDDASNGDIGKTEDGDPPRFKTAPEEGVDANFDFIFLSCYGKPGDYRIWRAMNAFAPDFIIELGDNGYPDSAAAFTGTLADFRSNFSAMARYDVVQSWQRYRFNVQRRWAEQTWDDHDYGGGEQHMDYSNKANALQVFKERGAYHTLASPSNGIWRSFAYANCRFIMLDTRYQRKAWFDWPSTIQETDRFPATSTKLADTGSGGQTLLLKAADSPDTTADIYKGWYAKVVTSSGTYWRIVQSSGDAGGGQVTCDLGVEVPNMAAGDSYFLRDCTLLNGSRELFSPDSQVAWLVSEINAATERFVFICSPCPWNRLGYSDDNWTKLDDDMAELEYVKANVTRDPDTIIVLSGDSHRMGLSTDSETETFFGAEFMQSPTDRDPSEGSHVWNKGVSPFPPGTADPTGAGTGKFFALVKVRKRQVILEAWWAGSIFDGYAPMRMAQIRRTVLGGQPKLLQSGGLLGG